MQKVLLINILTHGDELVGKKVSEEISRKYPFLIGRGVDIQIANEQAYMAKKRYIAKDLNRVFPGDPDGSYEEQRAFTLAPTVASYECVIDIHSTESGAGDMVIVTKIDQPTVTLLKYLSPKYVLYMNILPDTSLISQAKIGIAFEMGSDTNNKTYSQTVFGVERILSYLKVIPETPSFAFPTRYFEVFSSVPKTHGAILEASVENFKQIKKGETFAKNINGEMIIAQDDFYPVIFGNTNYENIFGFAGRVLTL